MNRERLTALNRSTIWVPQPGPQSAAFLSKADQLLYGGSAGGGKTDLAVGLSLTRQRRSLLIRREGTQLQAVTDRFAEVLGTRDGLNASRGVWRLPGGRQVRFGGVPDLGDEQKFQGQARDFLAADEAAQLLELQVRFLLGWVRTTDPRQRCRALLCSNPPTGAEGEWIIQWFAPWLDPAFPTPAAPGELRYVVMLDEGEMWVDGPQPFLHKGERLQPISRTFIPSRVADNRYLAATNYERQLQALPEPLRSQMLRGDFMAGRRDDEWQVIPSAWVKAAMARWKRDATPGAITSVGVDPSRGGDEAPIAPRRGWRYDELLTVKPDATGMVSGGAIAAKVLEVLGDSAAPAHLDVIGEGGSAYDHLEAWIGQRCVPVDGREATEAKDFSGRLGFFNKRAEIWWRFREALDPQRVPKVELPPDQRLYADLVAPRYRVTARGIQVEEKTEIKKRLGRSPDRGDAVVLGAIRTPIFRDLSGSRPPEVLNAFGYR